MDTLQFIASLVGSGVAGSLITLLVRPASERAKERTDREQAILKQAEAVWESRKKELEDRNHHNERQIEELLSKTRVMEQQLFELKIQMDRIQGENALLRGLVEDGLRLSEEELAILRTMRKDTTQASNDDHPGNG